jgi:hypothetical protein
MRYHLLYEAEINGKRVSGERVLVTDDDLEGAARTIARESGASSIFVKKRFWSNRPAKDADVINKVFVIHEERRNG